MGIFEDIQQKETMKIYYETLTEAVTPISVSFSFPEERIELRSFNGSIYKAEKKDGSNYYTIDGEITFEYSDICDRCALGTVISGSGTIQIHAVPGAAEDKPEFCELSDEDCDYYLTHPDFIDLYNILRQETFLMLPAKIVCEKCDDYVDLTEDYNDCDIKAETGNTMGFLSKLLVKEGK
jgi:uncharacterized metal-binding protein YceD (DUF177 family)